MRCDTCYYKKIIEDGQLLKFLNHLSRAGALTIPIEKHDLNGLRCRIMCAIDIENIKEKESSEYGYHCTTKNKLKRYKESGRIIAPVRYWPNLETAKRWNKKAGRDVILKIKIEKESYPLPDHKPARWCRSDITVFEEIEL